MRLTPEERNAKRAAMIELWEIDGRLRADSALFEEACNRYWRAIQAIDRRNADAPNRSAHCGNPAAKGYSD